MTQALPDIFGDSVDTLREIEELAASRAVKPFVEPFRKVLAMLMAVWPGDDATPAAKKLALAKLDTESMMEVLPEVERQILRGATDALEHGIKSGLAQVGVPDPDMVKAFKRKLPLHLGVTARAVSTRMRRRVDVGTSMLHNADTQEQALAALALVNPTPVVSAHTRWLANRASNEGLLQVAAETKGIVVVWVAERDGCVHCLAYAGHKRSKRGYPAGLTFGKKPLRQKELGPVDMPPLHPNCRCTQWLLHEDVAKPVIQALAREAKRSILRGWSVESESQTIRLDAARRLLAKQPAMPKSVQIYARTSIKEGRFKRGRAFPKR